MKKAMLYIHGKGGSYLEADQYKKNCSEYDVIGVDYNEYLPWLVQPKIKEAYEDLTRSYDEISIIANSIGAYFAMHTLQSCPIKKALFISPILDMEKLILDMMSWANVTEKDLFEKGVIPTTFGETLSWDYLKYVRENPISWNVPTEILYAKNDHMTSRSTVDRFIAAHPAHISIMEKGEHWFHTAEQLAFLDDWMKKVISPDCV